MDIGLSHSALTFNTLIEQVKSFISLDISQAATGFARWNGITLTHGIQSFPETESVARRAAFRAFITSLVDNREFEFIAIEDTIGGINYKTNRNLAELNCIVDDMMEMGLIPKSPIIRKTASEWRKLLKRITFVEDIPRTAKDEVKARVQSLGFTYGATHDVYDAVGMACGVIAALKLDKESHKQRGATYDLSKGYFLKPFESVDQALSYLDKSSCKYTLRPREVLGVDNSDVLKWFKKVAPDYNYETAFILVTTVQRLGRLALRYGWGGGLALDSPFVLLAVKKIKA